jgi:UDP-N-acetylglucosamine:LPS N-acetylglucosamine transferase
MISDAGLDAELGRSIEILHEPTFETYYRRFNERLQDTDILWTKPSEMTFYAALGLPLIFSWPVGVHERYNRRWAVEAGAGLKQRDPRYAGDWLAEMLSDGTLAASAWSGFMRLPKFGTYRIVEALGK